MSSASGGLRSPYLLPGSSPDPLPGLLPWTPRGPGAKGLQSPRLPLLWSPKILKLYSVVPHHSYACTLFVMPPPNRAEALSDAFVCRLSDV